MNRRKIMVWAAILAVLVLGMSTVLAEASESECDRSDTSNMCQASISIFVFVDRSGHGECDTFYNSGIDFPIEGARITFITPNGNRIQRITGHTGLLNLPSVDFSPEDEAFIEIEYPARYRNTALVPCPSSPVRKRITRDSFGPLGSTQVAFCASQYVPRSTH